MSTLKQQTTQAGPTRIRPEQPRQFRRGPDGERAHVLPDKRPELAHDNPQRTKKLLPGEPWKIIEPKKEGRM